MKFISKLFLMTLLGVSFSANSLEGFWTSTSFPDSKIGERFEVQLSDAWISHVSRSTFRILGDGGCSGSSVSPNGLLITNHHCILECLRSHTEEAEGYVDKGWVASGDKEELICSNLSALQTVEVDTVTELIEESTEELSSEKYWPERKKVESELIRKCEKSGTFFCKIVEHVPGNIQLYKHLRHNDLRLVFAPGYAVGQLGGDKLNFHWPRYSLDIALLRIYKGGKPLRLNEWLKVDFSGPGENEFTVAAGYPGSTSRYLETEQLITQRDVVLPAKIRYFEGQLDALNRYAEKADANMDLVKPLIRRSGNEVTVAKGELSALINGGYINNRIASDRALRLWVESNIAREAKYDSAWKAISEIEENWRRRYANFFALNKTLPQSSDLYFLADKLLRYANISNADSPIKRNLESILTSSEPYDAELEFYRLKWGLEFLRWALGENHPLSKKLFSQRSAEEVAANIVSSSKLSDPSLRAQFLSKSIEEIRSSNDPAIQLVLDIRPYANELMNYLIHDLKPKSGDVMRKMSQAREAFEGPKPYTNADGTLRFSFGTIKGLTRDESSGSPFTTLGGLLAIESTQVPVVWESNKERVDLSTRINQVSSHDAVAGISGGPIVNIDGELVGIVFDGNQYALGGTYFYDEELNRVISVHPAALMAALTKLYGGKAIYNEILNSHNSLSGE